MISLMAPGEVCPPVYGLSPLLMSPTRHFIAGVNSLWEKMIISFDLSFPCLVTFITNYC